MGTSERRWQEEPVVGGRWEPILPSEEESEEAGVIQTRGDLPGFLDLILVEGMQTFRDRTSMLSHLQFYFEAHGMGSRRPRGTFEQVKGVLVDVDAVEVAIVPGGFTNQVKLLLGEPEDEEVQPEPTWFYATDVLWSRLQGITWFQATEIAELHGWSREAGGWKFNSMFTHSTRAQVPRTRGNYIWSFRRRTDDLEILSQAFKVPRTLIKTPGDAYVRVFDHVIEKSLTLGIGA